jgi:hypothetical protein
MIAKYIMDSLQKNPIVRVINLESKECLGAYQKEMKELEKKTSAFNIT